MRLRPFAKRRSASGRLQRPRLLRRGLRALAREDGVTLLVTLGLMIFASALVGAAFMADSAEVHLSQSQTQGRKAYYAAQAGISWYLFHLAQNGAFLTYCTEPAGLSSSMNPLNQLYKAASGREEIPSSELHKISVPGASEEEYAIQLIPQQSAPSGDEKCDTSKLYETMIEKSGHWKGSFRVRSTGFSGTEKRSIVATFKNEGFLDFVYFTEFETQDPATYPALNQPSRTPHEAEEHCGNVYGVRAGWCEPIFFETGDEVKGPMHTNDHVAVGGSPVFGRESGDAVEFGVAVEDSCGKPDKGYSEFSWNSSKKEWQPGNCGTPKFQGTEVPVKEEKSITPPPTDNELDKWAESGYALQGAKEVVLEKTKIRIKKAGSSEEGEVKSWPTDGVIYVENSGACSEEYRSYDVSYPGELSCGNVYVRGEYSYSLTIGAAANVIVDGDVEPTNHESNGAPLGNAELGLIANGFVRVYHPVDKDDGKPSCSTMFGHTTCSCPANTTENSSTGYCQYENTFNTCNAPSIGSGTTGENPNELPGTEGTMSAPVIDAGILAVNHSFTVDNLECPKGTSLGTLTVHGAIAQKFRGIVATSSPSGYVKNYEYDNRFAAGEPPHFLNPVQASWKIERETLAKPPK